MSAFKVGDVVIGQNFTVNLERNGQEAVVISAAEFGYFANPQGGVEYCHACEVRWADGCREWQKTYRLRLRKPPQQDSHERTFMAEIHKLADKAPQRQGETA